MADPRPRPQLSSNRTALPPAITDVPGEVRLADNAKLSTRRALLLGAKAAAEPHYKNVMAAAQAMLDAGRPAAARRWAAEAVAIDSESTDAKALLREAQVTHDAAPRVRERGGEAVVAALVETLGGDLGRMFMIVREYGEAGEEVTALDLLNRALAKVGGAGLDIRMDGDHVAHVRRITQRQDRVAAHTLLAQVDAEGAPCHGCGAPRWTFAHDPELGEFCGQCGWPLPASALDAGRRQKSVEELREETAALREQVAERDKTVATRDREIAAMQGRLDRVQRTATGLHRQQRAARFRGPIDATAVPTTIPADATIEELQDQARQALALAQAGRDRVDQIAVEIARRAAE